MTTPLIACLRRAVTRVAHLRFLPTISVRERVSADLSNHPTGVAGGGERLEALRDRGRGQRPAVAAIPKAGGRYEHINSSTAVSGLGTATSIAPGDLARTALLLVARSPKLFAHHHRAVAGVPSATLFPVLEQAPRYLT